MGLLSLLRRRPSPPAPTAEHVAEIEREIQAGWRDEDERREQAIAEAECAQQGHIVPEAANFNVDESFTPWGMASPFRAPPSCRRCGAELKGEASRPLG